jgi:ABC-type taurine transport system ATPase subunit
MTASSEVRLIDVTKIKYYDNIVMEGIAPIKVAYLTAEKSEKFASQPSQWMSVMLTVYNADTLGIRPDLIKVLPMDEPFAALDVQTRAKMQGFLLDVWCESGASVIFVTHHIDEAMALADRVVVCGGRATRSRRRR